MIDIQSIAKKYPLPAENLRYVSFFLACLLQVKSKLPNDAQVALDVATRYWQDNSATKSDLREQDKRCAEFWRADGRHADTPYRLVAFVLTDPIVGNPVDNLDWFEVFMERLGGADHILQSASNEWFPLN